MRLKHIRRVVFATLGAGIAMVLAAGTAAAGPVTGTITGSGSTGTLPSGVTWAVTPGQIASGQMTLQEGSIQRLTLSEPATVQFDVTSLAAGTATGTECVTLPVGVVPVTVNPNHTYDPTLRRVCGLNEAGNEGTANSTFRLTNATALQFQGTGGNTALARVVRNFQVTVERDEAVLVDDSAYAARDTSKTVDIQDNDTIPDGSTGWEVDETTTEGGTVVDNGDGTVTYTPRAEFLGTDTFTYRVTGPDGVEHEATVTITVTRDGTPEGPMIAPGMAAVTLLGAGLLTAIRRRKA